MIAAAGSGERLGAGGPKALVAVAGRPLIAWCLDAFVAAERVVHAVIAGPRDGEDELEAAVAPAREALALEVVTGGETRAESVAAALARVDSELVAVHDAARPLVTGELVDAILAELAALAEVAGVVAAAPVADTVKLVGEPGDPGASPAIVRTESRDRLWAAQTPQAFRTAALRAAHGVDRSRLAKATDDAMLVEEMGATVLVHPSPATNLKVTTPDDLRVVELLLADRQGLSGSE